MDALEGIASAAKTFDSRPKWRTIPDNRGREILEIFAAIRLNGALEGGASLRISTPRLSWERDVYGHIEVRRPDVRPHLRLMPIEWRPLHKHENPAYAPTDLRFLPFLDRWHPFEDNRSLGIEVFTQAKAGVVRPLPRAISSFREYIDLAAAIWNFPEVKSIETPEWSRLLL